MSVCNRVILISVCVGAMIGQTPKKWPNVLVGQCDISQFNPAGDGSTDDSAVFTTAASSCAQITLSQKKTYLIGNSISLSAGITVPANASGGQLIVANTKTLTFGNSAAISAPPLPLFSLQGTGAVAFGQAVTSAYPEWFGAVGDNSTDDTTAIQNTINALSAGAVALSAKQYKITAALTVTKSHVGFTGLAGNPESAQLTTTSASIDFIQFTGVSIPSQIAYNFVRNVGLYRGATPTGSASGVKSSFTVHEFIERVVSSDSIRGFYFTGTNNAKVYDATVAWAAGTSGSRYGFYLDGANANASPYFRNTIAVNVANSGVTTYAFYDTGTQIKDLTVDIMDAAGVAYCAYIDGSGTSGLNDYDIHLRGIICDGFTNTGFYVTSLGQGGNVSVVDSWTNPANTGSQTYGFDIESSTGVAISGANQIFAGSNFAHHIGVYLHNSYRCTVTGNMFRGGVNFLKLDTGGGNTVTGNSMFWQASQATTDGITLINASRNSISANGLDGPSSGATTGIKLDSNSGFNSITGNVCNPGAYTTCFSNAGGNNVITGVQN